MSDFALAQEIVDLVYHNKDIRKIVVKLNESFTGEGNAVLDLTTVITEEDLVDLNDKNPDLDGWKKRLEQKVMDSFESMKFASKVEKWESFKYEFDWLKYKRFIHLKFFQNFK